MKTLFTILAFFLVGSMANAQFITPGDGETYTMDDLVSISGGVVIFDGASYIINQDLTIATNDGLEILDDLTVKVAFDKRINIHGTLVVDPPEEVTFTSVSAMNRFKGFRFEDATDDTMMKNTIIEFAGGIQLIGTHMLFENCTIRYFDMSNTSAAINLHGSNPVIQNCLFLENAGSAIGSGANVQASPQILYNEFISNGTANTNRPQINLGPSAADTLKIIGNYIEGEYTMAGGIAVANLMSVGHTLALIKDNYVVNNRYGYAGLGSQITSIIQNNHFIDNNIQGEPMLGGSGLNFMGGTTNQAFIKNNIIKGNLWGVTIQNNARPNLGQDGNELTGYNVIENNINTGTIYGLYNNTPESIFAQHNYWGTDDPDVAAGYIVDQDDDPSLGPVTFLPIWEPENLVESFVLEADHNDQLDEDVYGTIDQDEQTIHILLPSGVSTDGLIPTLQLSDYAVADPPGGQAVDLTEPLVYTITAFHGEERTYTVTAETEGPELFTVTFNVLFEVFGFDPDDYYVVITGTMTDWAEPGTDPELEMEKISDDPLIYSKTFLLEEGTYEYKYFSDFFGEGWDGGEWPGDPHRVIEVTGDMTVEDLVYDPGHYNVYFEILDDLGEPIHDAVIKLGTETNDPGDYTFNYVTAGLYAYMVEKASYYTIEDSIQVTGHTFLTVTLYPDDTGLSSKEKTSIYVFPNPAVTHVAVESNLPVKGIRIFDLPGRVIYESNPPEIFTYSIDCRGFKPGLYFMQVFTTGGMEIRSLQIIRK
ncbi:MAG: T9SS C-terminal target domain-containing protein [Bacteroidia bacterium]|nr:MAG: T9SS C-terminal target domain-containing protein [Bacteroidia bacterium]